MIRLIVFLGILGICTISHAAYAQKKDNGDDVYGIPRSPKDTVNHHRTIIDDKTFTIDDFVDGYVMLLSGAKRSGLIRFNDVAAIYKDTTADKITRYSPKEITEFVAAADTFRVRIDTAIVPPTPHMASFGDKLFVSKIFVKEMVYGNKLSLYKQNVISTSSLPEMMVPIGPNGAMRMPIKPDMGITQTLRINKTIEKNIFFIKRPGETRYTNIPTNNKDFKKVLAAYFKDNDTIVQGIKADKLVYEDIEEIVNQYNHKN